MIPVDYNFLKRAHQAGSLTWYEMISQLNTAITAEATGTAFVAFKRDFKSKQKLPTAADSAGLITCMGANGLAFVCMKREETRPAGYPATLQQRVSI